MHVTARTHKGFTIVELLIVIVVIGILAAITIVSYNGIQKRAENAARATEFKQWVNIVKAYHATHGVYPPALGTPGVYCLGTGFPNGGRCHSDGYESNSVDLMNQLSEISSLPSGPRKRLGGNYSGPFIGVNNDGFAMRTVLNGNTGVCQEYNLKHDFSPNNDTYSTCALGFFD